jgi:hypothetical protein
MKRKVLALGLAEHHAMIKAFLALAFAAVALTPAAAQSWGRGGAYAGADTSQGYRQGHGHGGDSSFTPNFKEPCWSAASSKCAREQSRNSARRLRQ